MRSEKSVGRITGILLLVQLAGLIVPFVLLLPIASKNFLAIAAAASFQIKVAVFLLFANCALTIGISISAWRVFRRYGPALALLLVALSMIMFSLQAVDNAHVMSMLSLSQHYAAGGSEDLFQALASVLSTTRRWIHYSELLAIDAWIFLLYGLLYRFALAPRALAVFGLLTVVLHFTGITLPLFLGYQPVVLMGATMALSQVLMALYLIAKGFKEPPTGVELSV